MKQRSLKMDANTFVVNRKQDNRCEENLPKYYEENESNSFSFFQWVNI